MSRRHQSLDSAELKIDLLEAVIQIQTEILSQYKTLDTIDLEVLIKMLNEHAGNVFSRAISSTNFSKALEVKQPILDAIAPLTVLQSALKQIKDLSRQLHEATADLACLASYEPEAVHGNSASEEKTETSI